MYSMFHMFGMPLHVVAYIYVTCTLCVCVCVCVGKGHTKLQPCGLFQLPCIFRLLGFERSFKL